jgi:hypothetical protein
MTNHLGDGKSLVMLLILAVVAGGIFGVMFYYIYTAVASVVGRWLGGHAKTNELLRVIGYATFPVTLSLPILAIQIIIFGNEMFERDFDIENYNTGTMALYFVALLIQLSLSLWAFCFMIIGISEVQKFSKARALGNILLAGLLLLAGMTLLILPFMFFRGS